MSAQNNFFGELHWNSPDDVSPSTPDYWVSNAQRNCSYVFRQRTLKLLKLTNWFRMSRASAMIDSCGRAKIMAAMALDLFVLDGQLHPKRNNWGCPFRECKENFDTPKDLMRHVSSCDHYSEDKLYCNICRGDNCVLLQCQRCSCCLGDDHISDNEKGSGKKKTFRKIKKIFSRSRTASVSSMGSTAHIERPKSTSSWQGASSFLVPTPGPSNGSRKWSLAYSQEKSPQSFETPSDPASRFELAAEVVAELSEDSSTSPLGARNRDSEPLVSAISQSSALESPQSQDFQGHLDDCPSSDKEVVAHAAPFPPCPAAASQVSINLPSTLHPASQQGFNNDHEFSWDFDHRAMMSEQQGGLQNILEDVYDEVPSTGYSCEMEGDRPYLQDQNLFPSQNHQPTNCPPTNYRLDIGSPSPISSEWTNVHNSAEPLSSIISPSTLIHQGSEFPPWANHGQHTISSGTKSPISAIPLSFSVATSSRTVSTPTDTENYNCPVEGCSYVPTGKITQRKAYLQKHITNKHNPRKFPCIDCGKDYSRQDNLLTHQKNYCSKKRYYGHQAPRWNSIRQRGNRPPRGMGFASQEINSDL